MSWRINKNKYINNTRKEFTKAVRSHQRKVKAGRGNPVLEYWVGLTLLGGYVNNLSSRRELITLPPIPFSPDPKDIIWNSKKLFGKNVYYPVNKKSEIKNGENLNVQ